MMDAKMIHVREQHRLDLLDEAAHGRLSANMDARRDSRGWNPERLLVTARLQGWVDRVMHLRQAAFTVRESGKSAA